MYGGAAEKHNALDHNDAYYDILETKTAVLHAHDQDS